MPRYDKLPQHHNSGAPSDIFRRENERYLNEGEDISDPRVREAVKQRRLDEYARRRGDRGLAPTRIAADLIDDVESLEWYSKALFHTHNASCLAYSALTIGIFVYIAIFHWGQHHGIGKFPIESNFLHDVGGRPINEDRKVTHIHFAYILILIPFAGMLYHGTMSTFGYLPFGIGRFFDAVFVTYFYDNILHHMGSAKYIFYSVAAADTTFITLVLVGMVDIFNLISLALLASIVYGLIHIGDWQFGKNMMTYRVNLKNAKTSAVKAMATMVEGMPANMFAGGKNDPNTAESLARLVDATITLPVSMAQDVATFGGNVLDAGLQLTEDTVMRLGYVSDALMRGIAASVGAVLPPDQVASTYIMAMIVQLWVHITILVYYIEAVQNAGFHELQWYVTFAFIMHFLPTLVQLAVYFVYWLQWDSFNLYVHKEMALIASHTVGLCAFTLAIFIGTLDIEPLGVLYT